jgi:hypothetical protein
MQIAFASFLISPLLFWENHDFWHPKTRGPHKQCKKKIVRAKILLYKILKFAAEAN